MTKVMSIDSSTSCTGIAYFEDGELKQHGIINLKKEKDVEKRINDMGDHLIKTMGLLQPEIVYVERPRGRNNPEVLRKLAIVTGIIRGYCIYKGIYFEEIGPTEWRKILGFKQGAGVKREDEKRQSLEYVAEKYGIAAQTDDESDAICIGDAMFKKYEEKGE